MIDEVIVQPRAVRGIHAATRWVASQSRSPANLFAVRGHTVQVLTVQHSSRQGIGEQTEPDDGNQALPEEPASVRKNGVSPKRQRVNRH